MNAYKQPLIERLSIHGHIGIININVLVSIKDWLITQDIVMHVPCVMHMHMHYLKAISILFQQPQIECLSIRGYLVLQIQDGPIEINMF